MRMKQIALDSVRTIVSLAILLAGVGAFAAISHKEPAAQRPDTKPEPLKVRTKPVSVYTSKLDLRADGVVVPYREVHVASEVAGRVVTKSKFCRPGLIVRKGDVLAEMDKETYELEVQRLAVEVEQATANLHELDVELRSNQQLLSLSEEQLKLRKSNLDRVRGLSGRQIATSADVEEARRQELEATNLLSTLHNQIAQLEAKKKTQAQAHQLALVKKARATVDLDRTHIVAPCDGVILTCEFEENSYVAAGSELCVLEDTTAVDVRSNLRMDQLQWIFSQQETITSATQRDGRNAYALPKTDVTIRYSMGSQKYEWPGELVSYDGLGVDERTRTVPVRIRVHDPIRKDRGEADGDTGFLDGPQTLIRGMYVEVILHVQPQKPLLLIPEESVQPGSLVWCVRDDKLVKAHVSIAQTKSPDVLLDSSLSAIKEGDRLVFSPMPSPMNGMQVVEESNP